jgi:hypothetical protein
METLESGPAGSAPSAMTVKIKIVAINRENL